MPTDSSVIVTGLPEFDRAIAGLVERVNLASRKIVEDGLALLASSAKRRFRPRPGGQRTAASGRTYYIYRPPYQAIPPQPTSRSGALVTSIGAAGRGGVFDISKTPGGWMGVVGTRIQYAPYVEYGTRYMAAEPFMEWSVDRNRAAILAMAEARFAEALA